MSNTEKLRQAMRDWLDSDPGMPMPLPETLSEPTINIGVLPAGTEVVEIDGVVAFKYPDGSVHQIHIDAVGGNAKLVELNYVELTEAQP